MLVMYYVLIEVNFPCRVTGGELFEDIVAREYYSEADARYTIRLSMVTRARSNFYMYMI